MSSRRARVRSRAIPKCQRNSTDRSPDVGLFEFGRLGPSQIVLGDRFRADALADGAEDCIADGGADRAGRRLAQFGEAAIAGQAAEMDVDLRRIASPQNWILVEIALDHTAVLDVDLFVQCHVEPEDHPALDQVQHRVAIDNTTAIERRVQLMDFQYATFGHLDRGDDADRRAGLGLEFASSLSRYSSGSMPAASAHSSMKVSTM